MKRKLANLTAVSLAVFILFGLSGASGAVSAAAGMKKLTPYQLTAEDMTGGVAMSDYSNTATVRVSQLEQKAYSWGKTSDWALSELLISDALDLYPSKLYDADLTKPVTRAEFAAVAVKLYEAMSGKSARPAPQDTFGDTKDEDVLKAYALDIVIGTGGGGFSPGDFLTREQAAVILIRVYKKVYWDGWTLADDKNYRTYALRVQGTKFADDGDISAYAKEAVYVMAGAGILKGTGGKFLPEEAASREQAVIMSKRTYENNANLWKDWTIIN